MTNLEIINSFPECKYIKKENIENTVVSLFNDCKVYKEIYNYVYNNLIKYYPRPDGKSYDSPEMIEYREYYFGHYDESFNRIAPLIDWIESIEDEFIKRHGMTHTYEEACDIAAKKWVDLIFGFHIQDNGAMNESHGGGFPACALGTMLKNNTIDRMENVSEISKKTYELIKQFYIDDKDRKGRFYELSVDYGPNGHLHDILVKAGVDSHDASNICPWKTRIHIDKKDNSVCYGTYGREDYL